MKQEVLIGQQDYTVLILVRDSTTGAPKTALTFESAGIDICYTRVETDNDVVVTDGAPVTTTLTGAHVDWGFVLVDDTRCPGLYKLDIADGVFASGAWSAVVSFICTGCDPVHIEFVLVAFDPRDGVRLGLTALPNAAADAAGGLPISDAGGLDLDAKIGALTYTVAGDVDVNVQSWKGAAAPDISDAATIAAAVRDVAIAGAAAGSVGEAVASILTDTAEIGAAGAGLTNINLPNQTMDITGNITGNLSGSVGSVTGAVGSVTGAVGSVTGNVGGNVTGSIGSLSVQAKADVNAEVVDTLRTDTSAELAGVPAAVTSIANQLNFLFMKIRNEEVINSGAGTATISNNAGTAIGTSTISDAAGVFTKGEYA
jgi:hypothetical protein